MAKVCGHEHDYERMFDVAPNYNPVLPYLSGKTTCSPTPCLSVLKASALKHKESRGELGRGESPRHQ